MATWTETNPATVDELTNIDDINAAHDNTLALRDGTEALKLLVGVQADSTATGTQNDFAVAAVTVRWNGASQATFNSIAVTYDGQIVIFDNVSSTIPLKIGDQSAAGGTAANRVICPSTTGQMIGPGGKIGLRYDGTSDRWRVLFINPGAPITVTHSDANFNGAGTDASWVVASGDQNAYKTIQHGKMVTAWFTIVTSTVASTPANLRIILPNSWVTTSTLVNSVYIDENGTFAIGRCFVVAANSYIQIEKVNGANFSNTTDTTAIQGQIAFEID